MSNPSISSQYYGMINLLKERSDQEMVIFIVDDNQAYLKILERELSDYPNFDVYTFISGEDCLENLHLAPDLVILDYHLDEHYPLAKNGDIILMRIKERLPDAEVIIVSGDEKIQLVNELVDLGARDLIFKNNREFGKIRKLINSLYFKKAEKTTQYFMVVVVLLLLVSFLTFMIFQ